MRFCDYAQACLEAHPYGGVRIEIIAHILHTQVMPRSMWGVRIEIQACHYNGLYVVPTRPTWGCED